MLDFKSPQCGLKTQLPNYFLPKFFAKNDAVENMMIIILKAWDTSG